MPVTITKTVTFAGDLPETGARYAWAPSWTSGGSGWVAVSEASADVWNFVVEDWTTGSAGETREVTYTLNHHLASSYPTDQNLTQSFTITQHADSNV